MTQLIVKPLYSGLIVIMDFIPGIDVGVAVIIFTIIVRLILFPLSKSALLTQVEMKDIEPEANKIRAQYANDRQTQALKIMELYKSRGVKPFSGILLLIIQLPILLGLVSVFYHISPIQPDLLYSFIHAPTLPRLSLFGLDLTQKNLFLSLSTGIIQFLQLHFSLASRQQKAHIAKYGAAKDAQSAMMNNMTTQMKYILPFFAFATTYWIIPVKYPQAASIIALYWSVSTLFTLGQELFIRKKYLGHIIK